MVEDGENGSEGPAEGNGADASDGELAVGERFAEARREAGLDPGAIGSVRAGDEGPGLVSPYLILYAGFFLGPGLALASSLAVAPRRLTVRRVSVMVGIAGAAWCAVQGVTGVFNDGWSTTALQVLRTGMNFGASVLIVLFWRQEAPSCFLHSRRSIALSFAAGTVLLLAFLAIPPETLAYLGR